MGDVAQKQTRTLGPSAQLWDYKVVRLSIFFERRRPARGSSQIAFAPAVRSVEGPGSKSPVYINPSMTMVLGTIASTNRLLHCLGTQD